MTHVEDMIQHNNTRFGDAALAVLHILSMPVIASETSNILFSLMPLRPFT
jgi:hypothetical protein